MMPIRDTFSITATTIGSTVSNYFLLGKPRRSSAKVVGLITVRFKLKRLNIIDYFDF